MSNSYSVSEVVSFTITHAMRLASKVATDLKRIQRFYGSPSDASIADYEEELAQFIKAGYLGDVTYGFRRGSRWIEPTLRYTARDLVNGVAGDDDPGKILPCANTADAAFYSYLTYSTAWYQLTEAERDSFRKRLPIQRMSALEPTIDGYLHVDRTYSAGGRALDRACVRTL